MKLSRIDYPMQCHDPEQFTCLQTQGGERQNASNSRILILAQSIDFSDPFDPAINLASFYRREEFQVDILVLDKVGVDLGSLGNQYSELGLGGVTLHALDRKSEVLNGPIADLMADSFHFLRWLKNYWDEPLSIFTLCDPTIVYYCLMAKKCGQAFDDVRFNTVLGSSSFLEHIKNSQPITSIYQLSQFYAQRMVLQESDQIISNNEHALNWIKNNECAFVEGQALHFHMPLNQGLASRAGTVQGNGKCLTIVIVEPNSFEMALCIQAFEDSEFHSSSLLFLVPSKKRRQALKRIRSSNLNQLHVMVESIPENVDDWSQEVRRSQIIVLPQQERLSQALVSWLEMCDVKLLTSGLLVGGNNGSEGRRFVPFCHNPQSIVEGLSDALHYNVDPSNSREDQDWLCLAKIAVTDKISSATIRAISVTVCISHYDRPKLLARAIDSILAQSYACEEIIVVDDGSSSIEAQNYLKQLEDANSVIPITVLRQKNSFIGASRNLGLSQAKSDYILFMDDDNEAKSNELEVFVNSAVNSDADVLTCFSSVFFGETPDKSIFGLKSALFLGANRNASLISNPYGDSNLFAKVTAIRSIGGFSESFRVGRDDQELFVRAQIAGLTIQLVPQALYYYRLNLQRIRHSHINQYSGHMRVIQSLHGVWPIDDVQQIAYMQGLAYSMGPYMPNARKTHFANNLKETLRVPVARYSWLYNLVTSFRKIFF